MNIHPYPDVEPERSLKALAAWYDWLPWRDWRLGAQLLITQLVSDEFAALVEKAESEA